jgi:hypothetical protein
VTTRIKSVVLGGLVLLTAAAAITALVPELRSPPNRGATIWAFALPD